MSQHAHADSREQRHDADVLIELVAEHEGLLGPGANEVPLYIDGDSHAHKGLVVVRYEGVEGGGVGLGGPIPAKQLVVEESGRGTFDN